MYLIPDLKMNRRKAVLGLLVGIINLAFPLFAHGEERSLEAGWAAACVAADCPSYSPAGAETRTEVPKYDTLRLDFIITPEEIIPDQEFTIAVKSNKDCELWLVDQSPQDGLPVTVLSPEHSAYRHFVGASVLVAGKTLLVKFQADNNLGQNSISALCFIGPAGDFGFSPEHIQRQIAGYRTSFGHDSHDQLKVDLSRALPASRVVIETRTILIYPPD